MSQQRSWIVVFPILISIVSLLVIGRPAEAQSNYRYGQGSYPYRDAHSDYPYGAWLYWGQPDALSGRYSYWNVPRFLYGHAYDYSYRPYPYGAWTYWGRPDALLGGSYSSYNVPRYVYAAADSAPVRSFYYSPGETESPAHLLIEVPSRFAQVWIEGELMRQEGTSRSFESPPLQPGSYTYTVRARWRQNGEQRNQTRTVRVRPGRNVTVRFGR